MPAIRRGDVSGPGWAWVLYDLTSVLGLLAWPTALAGPVLRTIGRLDDALARRSVWMVRP